jgi:6-phosphogluconate dehydrogenase
VVSQAVLLGVPTPCFSTALAFYDGYRSEMLPANLIQVPNMYKYFCQVFRVHHFPLEVRHIDFFPLNYCVIFFFNAVF